MMQMFAALELRVTLALLFEDRRAFARCPHTTRREHATRELGPLETDCDHAGRFGRDLGGLGCLPRPGRAPRPGGGAAAARRRAASAAARAAARGRGRPRAGRGATG